MVETLVAIAILMIAISGPLVVATRGLRSALYAKDQSTATFLAQEGMELLRNAKDIQSVDESGTGFYNGFVNVYGYQCIPANPCAIWINSPTDKLPSFAPCYVYSGCVLYNYPDDAVGYKPFRCPQAPCTPPTGVTPSIYTRKYYIQNVPGGNVNKEVQVWVIVEWNEGSITNSVSLSSQMTETAL